MEFFDVLVRYEVALWSAIDHDLARQGQISLAQVHALRIVERHAGHGRVQELSEDIGITVGAASKLVDRLERAGLVVRRPNPANRRSSLLALTEDGKRALRSASVVCRDRLIRAIGGEDVEPLTAALLRLQNRLGAPDAGTAA